MKYVTRILILFAVFVGAVWFMGTHMKEEKFSLDETVSMAESSFPVVSFLQDGQEVNLLYGYSGNMDATNFREATTPVGQNKTIDLLIRENGSVIKKVTYELQEVGTKEILSSGSISAIEASEQGKTVEFKLDGDLEVNKEYSLKITLVTDTSKKIHYFTRVKLLEQSYLKEELAFIQGFHDATFDKEKILEYTTYLERTDASASKSIMNVSIKSPIDLIAWGTMKPNVVSTIIPTIKEISTDIISVELSYLVTGEVQDTEGNVVEGETTYEVKEFYRIRYSTDRVYLLKYERSMDAIYDMERFDPTSLAKNSKSIDLGFTKENITVEATSDNSKIAFVDHGTLWYYDLTNNEVVKVLSLMKTDVPYYHGGYSENNIRILKLYENGNMDFLMYGYINRGDYEGRVGIVLYKYLAESNRIEEQVFVPLEYPYEVLEKNLDGFYYLSGVDTFYFSMDNVIYSYSIISRKTEIIAEDVTSSSFLLSEEGQFIAWQNASDPKESTSINILKLETEERFTITAKSGENLILLENSNANFVFGYVHSKDIVVKEDGTVVTPMYQIDIVDANAQTIKTYIPQEGYVSDVTQVGSRLEISLVKKEGKSYKANGSDFIVNKIEDVQSSIYCVKTTVLEELERVSIVLPSSFVAEEKPKIRTTENTIITEDTTVHIQERKANELKFYAYTSGHLAGSYKMAADAIQVADEGMGVVLDNLNHIIWERGQTSTRTSLSSMTEIYAGNGVNSVGACVSMLLKYNYVAKDAKELSGSSKSMYQLLADNFDYTPINLTGSTLSQVLYYVSQKRPVIAMKNGSDAVLIIGYDETSITYIDPAARTTVKTGLASATTMFESAGNVFVSYVK